jgi:multicomponent Na+:H+ antiporter subunit E
MKNETHVLLVNILLALAWGALTGVYTPVNLLAGFLLGYLALWLLQRTSTEPSGYFSKGPLLAAFILFFLWELIKANLRVMYDVLTPWHRMQPGIVAIPLDVTSDAEITLLANLISLTPGTLSLDVSDDRSTLYVHTMYMSRADTFRHSIKQGFERRVQEVFK